MKGNKGFLLIITLFVLVLLIGLTFFINKKVHAEETEIWECVHVLPSNNPNLDGELKKNLKVLSVSCVEEKPDHAVIFLQVGRPHRKHELGSPQFSILVGVWVTYNDGHSVKEGEWVGESNPQEIKGKSGFSNNDLVAWGMVAEAIQNGKSNFHTTVRLLRGP